MTKAKTRGEKWKDRVLSSYEFSNPAEELLVDETAATIDAIDTAPDLLEKRQQRLLLSRLLGQLNLPSLGESDRPSMNGKSVRGRRAVGQRWERAHATQD